MRFVLIVLLAILLPFPCFADDPIDTPVPIQDMGRGSPHIVPTYVPIQDMQIIRRPVPILEPIQTPVPIEDMTIIRVPQPPKRQPTPFSLWGCFRFGMWFQGYY